MTEKRSKVLSFIKSEIESYLLGEIILNGGRPYGIATNATNINTPMPTIREFAAMAASYQMAIQNMTPREIKRFRKKLGLDIVDYFHMGSHSV